MRKLTLTAGLALALGLGGSALADGPGGSHEEDLVCDEFGNCTTQWDNQVTCGTNNDVGGTDVYAAENGVEVCSDSADLPIQGRIIATTDDGGYVAADGDGDNPEEAQGWARLDGSGARCGDIATDDDTPAGNADATHPTTEDTQEDCDQEPPAPPE